MRDEDSGSGCPALMSGDPAHQAEQLAALAREARLLEFALQGDSDAARLLAAEVESALEQAMDADSPDELRLAVSGIETVLRQVVEGGMRLSAEMADIEVDGVLGTARMPVLTAVLTVR